MKRELFDSIEKGLCSGYQSLDRAAHKADDRSSEVLRGLAENALAVYNEFCEVALPLLSEADRKELESTRQKTHLLNE